MKTRFLMYMIFMTPLVWSQTTIKTAFLGNSYTYFNDLPSMIDSMANADGNDLIHNQNTPGGYSLDGHSTNATSLSLLTADNWDFIVLQDQSQQPSFPHGQVIVDVYPKAKILCDSIRSANNCAIPVFFNTWGRLNGDQQWDSINTFTKMNNRLYSAYDYMANVNNGMVSPVGLAFRAVYDNNSMIVTHMDLYASDGSHPSIYGSYLAACVFYNTLFNTNSFGNTYLPNGITQTEAEYLQQIAFNTMYMATSPIFDYTYPIALFDFNTSGLEATFNNMSEHAYTYSWNFGDNTSSSDEHPVHTYSLPDTYTVQLTANYCTRSSTYQQMITVTPLGLTDFSDNLIVYPNPTYDFVNIQIENVNSIEIVDSNGKLVSFEYVGGASKNMININGLPTGIYVLSIDVDGKILRKKIVKQ